MSVGDDFHGSEREAERELCGYEELYACSPELLERLRVRTELLREWCDENRSQFYDCECLGCRTRRELAKDKESPNHETKKDASSVD